MLAGLRLRQRAIDIKIARGLGLASIVAFVVAAIGEQLHGRPNLSVGQLVVLALLLAFAVWALRGLLLRSHGWFGFFLIALAALFEGATLIGVLLHGFVLIALPAFLARTAVVVCLAAGAALLPVIFRLAEHRERRPAMVRAGAGCGPGPEDDEDWEWNN